MSVCTANTKELEPDIRDFYEQVLRILNASRLPILIGGAFAFGCYTDITRWTKDLDVFVERHQVQPILDTLAAAGYKTELTNPVWLAKAFHGDALVDVIFSSGNGIATVDDEWFRFAVEGELLGIPVKLIPVEEMIWSKGFVMTRERYDGADVAHLLRVRAEQISWERLLRRFGPDWRVLLNHLILFGYVYPSERAKIPNWVMEELLERLDGEIHGHPPAGNLCQGVLLSDSQYKPDIEQWGYRDPRRLIE